MDSAPNPRRAPRLPLGRARAAARRAVVVLAGVGIAVVALAGTAFAHIAITPGSALAGSAAELTFRVPDEEATAATVEVQVKIPTDHPIAQLLVEPVPGWQVSVQTITLPKPVITDDGSFSSAVSLVTWKGGRIEPGQYQDFAVSADPLPTGVSQLTFKAIQTYSNGDVVRWIDVPEPGIVPEHPAPVLALTPAGTDTGGSAATAPGVTSGSGDGIPLALGASGLATGLLGLALGLTAWHRTRPRKGATDLTPDTTSARDAEVRVSP